MCGVGVPSVAWTVYNSLSSLFTALRICLNTFALSSHMKTQTGSRMTVPVQSTPYHGLRLLLGQSGAAPHSAVFSTRPFPDMQSPGLLSS